MKESKVFMINDWYLVDSSPIQITSISALGGLVVGTLQPFMGCEIPFSDDNTIAKSYGARPLSNLKPIEITREILEKLGFEKAGMQAVGCEAWYYYNAELGIQITVDYINHSVGVTNNNTQTSTTVEIGSELKSGQKNLYINDIQHCLRQVGAPYEIDSLWEFQAKKEEN